MSFSHEFLIVCPPNTLFLSILLINVIESSMKDRSCGVIPMRNVGDGYEFLLLQHKKKGHWAFPKGHPEENESDLEAALRELKEEAGITKIELFPDTTFTEEYNLTLFDGRDVEKTVVYFIGVTNQEKVIIQAEEVADFVWLPFEEAYEKITYPASKEMLNHANDFLNGFPH
jgi:bis(5'-nucleosidyl)-tetraphosphatase